MRVLTTTVLLAGMALAGCSSPRAALDGFPESDVDKADLAVITKNRISPTEPMMLVKAKWPRFIYRSGAIEDTHGYRWVMVSPSSPDFAIVDGSRMHIERADPAANAAAKAAEAAATAAAAAATAAEAAAAADQSARIARPTPSDGKVDPTLPEPKAIETEAPAESPPAAPSPKAIETPPKVESAPIAPPPAPTEEHAKAEPSTASPQPKSDVEAQVVAMPQPIVVTAPVEAPPSPVAATADPAVKPEPQPTALPIIAQPTGTGVNAPEIVPMVSATTPSPESAKVSDVLKNDVVVPVQVPAESAAVALPPKEASPPAQATPHVDEPHPAESVVQTPAKSIPEVVQAQPPVAGQADHQGGAEAAPPVPDTAKNTQDPKAQEQGTSVQTPSDHAGN